MLKVWNACLIVATFSLALLGTFLVRSGVLQSIHAFGDSTVGPYILGLIAVVLIGSTALIVSRLDDLRSEKRIDSLASREAVFLVNNLLLVALMRDDLLGHLLPADLGAVHRREGLAGGALVRPLHDAAGDRARPLHRHRAAARLAADQLGLGAGGSSSRRRSSPLAVGLGLALATDAADSLWALALFVFAAFALTGLAQEFWRGAAARRSLRRRLDAGGAARGRLAQPAPLRRLRGPRRRRRAADRDRRLLQLPDQPRPAAAAGGERRRRRPHGHLRAADGQRRPQGLHLRRGARRRAGRRAGRRRCARAAATSARPGWRRGRSAASSTARRPARWG